MEIIYLLIFVSMILVLVIICFLFWGIDSGQYDDLDGCAYEILMDNDKPADDVKQETRDSP